MALVDLLVRVHKMSAPPEFEESGGLSAIAWADKILRILTERKQQPVNESEQQIAEENQVYYGEAAEFIAPELPSKLAPSLENLGFVPSAIPSLEELGFCEPNCQFDVVLLRERLEEARPDLNASQFAESMCQLLEL